MSAFADTSFLFACYFRRETSGRALTTVQSATEPLLITTLVDFEFRQAVWFEVFRRRNGQPSGLLEVQACSGVAAFELDCEQGIWTKAEVQWDRLLASARELTLKHTARTGCRGFDLLHVASALNPRVPTFLSFDQAQCRLAQSEGLAVPFLGADAPETVGDIRPIQL